MSRAAPLIAITPDCDDGCGRSTETQYIVRANHAEAIRQSGGIPVFLPYDIAAIPQYLDCFDGFMVTGGTPGVTVKPLRTDFEMALIAAVLNAGRPLLGICNGMQMIGIYLGGKLVHSIPDEIAAAQDHLPFDVPDRAGHRIDIRPGSSLADLAPLGTAQVNSLHRQAISGEGRFRVSAVAPDGVVEAIEGLTKGYCLGLQWHPEYLLSPLDRAILRDFVQACVSTRNGSATA